MSRYRRARIPGATYFFTVNTYRRQRLLTNNEVLYALWEATRLVRAEHPFQLDAMVVLPDHLHAVWTLPPNDADYSTRWGFLKRFVSQRMRHRLGEPQTPSRHRRGELGLWQRRFREHQICDQADYARHVDYIHYNPVKHGLVRRVCDFDLSPLRAFGSLPTRLGRWRSRRPLDEFGEIEE